MTLTPFGFCGHCEHRRELVMTEAGVLACHVCDSMDVYDDREDYEAAQEALDSIMEDQ